MNRFARLALVALFPLVTGCEDDVTVNSITEPVENSPPQILVSGPELDPSVVVEPTAPPLWVLVTDADGEADIAAVFLNVQTITIDDMIIRPVAAEESCVIVNYTDHDTIDVRPFLLKSSFRITNQVMARQQGLYHGNLSYYTLTENGLEGDIATTGVNIRQCYSGSDYLYYLDRFGLYPPAVTTPIDVHVTYLEVSLHGISVTAYDQSGANVTRSFPDIRVRFTNQRESETLP